MARNHAAKIRQGTRIVNGRVKPTRSVKEVGQYGNSRPRDDKSVRRAKEVANDPRLQRAKEEQTKHEEYLRQLDDQLAQQRHVPYSPPKPETEVITGVTRADVADYVERTTREQGVPLHVEDPETIQRVATLLRVPQPAKPKPEVSWDALDLLRQGYHVNRVAQRIGVPVEQLQPLVDKDGYISS